MTWAPVPLFESEHASNAVLSPDKQYRYMLSRRWATGSPAIFVMLNPSTADAEADDPTVRRCMGFAMTWGLAALVVINLYAYRATDPHDLWKARDPVGPDNDKWLRREFLIADSIGAPVVAAWGVNAHEDRVRAVTALPGAHRMVCLGRAKDGAPRHPLYMPADSPLTPWIPKR